MPTIILLENSFGIENNHIHISTDRHGFIILGEEEYTIYDHFKEMRLDRTVGGVGKYVTITLRDGTEFKVSMSSEVYEEIKSIMFERKKDEYFRNING